MDKTIVLKPRLSEKAYAMSVALNTYVFEVPAAANRDQIASAVTAQFGVTVEDINIVIAKGKTKRTVRKGGRAVAGKRSDIKKAYVKLKDGDSLPFFAEAEEAAAADAKDKKETK